MPRLALAALLVALVLTDASAEPPTGFAEFPWGTTPRVLRDELLAKRCGATSEGRRDWYTLQCNDYRVEGLVVPVLRLDFEPENALAGYSMIIARGSYRRFRDLAMERFGPPVSRQRLPWQASVMSWRSDTVTATLIEDCGPETSCMEVSTRALDRRRQAVLERQRRDAAQSF